jgi:hypothetical protein
VFDPAPARAALLGAACVVALLAAPAAASAPPDDDLAHATPLLLPAPGTTTTFQSDNTDAALEPEEAALGCAGSAASVWFRVRPPTTRDIEVSTGPRDGLDTRLSVFSGATSPDLHTLTAVACNDDADTGTRTSRVATRMYAGRTYWVQVGTRPGTPTGPFSLTVATTAVPEPANDDLAAAAPLTGTSVRVVADTGRGTLAATDPGAPDGTRGGHTLWWRWTAPENGRAQFSTSAPDRATTNPYLEVFDDTGTPTRETALAVSDDTDGSADRQAGLVLDVTAGTTYRVLVGAYGAGGAVDLHIGPRGPGPAGDDLADAVVLAGASGTVEGDTTRAGVEPGEPARPWGAPAAASVWFRWTAPVDGPATFSTDGAAGRDTSLVVATGESIGELALVASNDDPPGTSLASLTFQAQQGTTYLVSVDGDGNRLVGRGPFALTWHQDVDSDVYIARHALVQDDALLRLTVDVGTHGPAVAEAPTLTWTPPAGAGLVGIDTDRGRCSSQETGPACRLDRLVSGELWSVTATYRLDGTTGRRTIETLATSASPDPVDDNRASDSVDVAVAATTTDVRLTPQVRWGRTDVVLDATVDGLRPAFGRRDAAVPAGSPVGTLAVFDGSRLVARVPVVETVARVRLARVGAGAHLYRAVFSPTSARFAGSESTAGVATSAVSIRAPRRLRAGTRPSLEVRVAGAPTRTAVRVTVAGRTRRVAVVDGVGHLRLPHLRRGAVAVSARWPGAGAVTASRSRMVLRVH